MNRPIIRFRPDGSFKLMQISDVQDLAGILPRTRELICAALDRERPDFVVFTGDQFSGNGRKLWFRNKDEKTARIKRTIRELLGPLEERGIPFTFMLGNHDHSSPLADGDQVACYMESPLCCAQESPAGVPGCANHVVPVYPARGDMPALLIYCQDSHTAAGLGYAPLDPAQVAWYQHTRDAWAEKNNGQPVPSMLFQHIPVEEIISLYKEEPKRSKTNLEGYGNYSGRFFVLDEEAAEGFMGELPSSPDINAGLFEAALERGEMLGMFFGHDHNNGFHGKVRGLTLGYAPSAGYSAYGPGRKRGVRVFEFSVGSLGDYKTRIVTDEELLGDSRLKLGPRLLDLTPSSPGDAKNKLRRAAIPALLVLLGIAGAIAALKLLLG